MHATRPRSSILHLFDPLASPAPSRDAPSPDSDKENSCPTLTEAFFGPILKQSSPVVLKRRLIDVGDVTVDDPSMLSMLTDEEQLDESMCDDDNDTLTLPRHSATTPARVLGTQIGCRTPTGSTPRTPLGELALDRDITPMARTKMYKRQPPAPYSSSASVIPTAPYNSNISSVVNTVNASGESFAFPGPIKPSLNYHDLIQDHHVLKRNSHDTETPRITISSVDAFSDSFPTLDLPTPTGSLLTDVSRPFASTPLYHASETSSLHLPAGLRPNPPRTSSDDPNRRSVDLYSSFQLQLQSEESSFDLLNDKISFFASSSGMESFLNAMEEDDSFDMSIEEKRLQQPVEIFQQKEIPMEGTKVSTEDAIPHIKKPEFSENINTPPTIATPSVEEAEPKTLQGPSPDEGLNSELPVPSAFISGQDILPAKLATREEPTPGLAINTSVFVPPSPNHRVVIQVGMHTPAPVVREAAPPPVYALRIVKRAKRPGHEKTNSSSSTSSTETASVTREQIETFSVPTEPAPAPANARPKSTLAVGAGRVAYGRVVAPTSTATLPSLSTGTGTGPRRVPIIDSQASSRAGFGNQRAPSPANMTGPKRVLVASSVRVTPSTTSGKVPAVSGLKAPAKYGTGSTAASALPRLVSRLPAPSGSGFARPRPAAGAMSSVSSGTGSQRNAEKPFPARRMVYGGQ